MSDYSQQPAFDFDHWFSLARNNPDEFEAQRVAVLEAAIQRAPAHARTRLRGLQWKLDAIRDTAGTPLGACVRMHQMMWERVVGDGGLLEVLQAATGERPVDPSKPRAAADILPFKPLNRKRSRRP